MKKVKHMDDPEPEWTDYREDEWELLQDAYNREQWEREFAAPPPSGIVKTKVNLEEV